MELALLALLVLLSCASEPCEGEILEHSSSYIWHWVLDPARLVIFAVSLLIITLGSKRAVHLDRTGSDTETEGVHNLSGWHIILLPTIGSLTLIIFFYFFDFIQFLFTIITTIVSLIAMYNLLHPVAEGLQVHCRDNLLGRSKSLQKGLTLLVSGGIAGLWVATGHWFYLDVLGGSLCVLMIQFMRVPSLKLSTFLLLALLAYDVFWVFCSSSIFKQNVMIAVATKRAENPVAIVAQKLNMPEIAKSQPPLSIPGKLLVPSFADDRTFAMLGLGDIVLPGLLLCFAMRYDTLSPPAGSVGPLTNSLFLTRLRLCFQRWSYFVTALLGYALGLITASVVVDITGAAQPALLYLVPATLIPLLVKATIQGDLRTMWEGPHFITSSSSYSRSKQCHQPLPF